MILNNSLVILSCQVGKWHLQIVQVQSLFLIYLLLLVILLLKIKLLILIKLKLICLIGVGVRVGCLDASSDSSSRLELLLQDALVVLVGRWLCMELAHELDLMDIGRSTQIQLLL